MSDQKMILQKYVSDMIALESHIFQAIDKQAKENESDPEIKQHFTNFASTLQSHQTTLEARLKALGGAANKPVKEGVSAVLGVAAGVIDKLRSDEQSKEFRDDYTALNLSLISYEMLYTTATALGDKETASLAASNAKDNAEFVSYIQHILPQVIVRELKKNYDVTLDESATQSTKELIGTIWK